MASWTNATGRGAGSAVADERTASTKGVLRPAETERLAGLRREAPVSPALVPYVERYWSVRWDLTGRPAYRAEVLSHPSVNLSVESGTAPRFGVALPVALLHGVVTRRFTVDLEGAGRTTAVKFRPGGFRAYTGRQLARDTVVALADWLPPGAHAPEPGALLRDVLAVDDDDDRASVLDAALAPYAADPAPAYLDLLALLGEVVEDPGLVRVEQVAARGGLTVRSLQRLFATYVSLGPKAVLARYRLQDAVGAMDAGEVTDLAALAATLGWFDQAHFSRDFRAVVGTTPSAYLARARAAVQE